jgi:hypothetical protein
VYATFHRDSKKKCKKKLIHKCSRTKLIDQKQLQWHWRLIHYINCHRITKLMATEEEATRTKKPEML